MSNRKLNILFVCVENSNRSQMAEAFARLHGGDLVDSWSAGSEPSGQINPKAVVAMKEKDIDLGTHTSKGLDDIPAVQWDWVITMGCGDACPNIPALNRDDWDIPDPRDMDTREFNNVRDEIEGRVIQLLSSLRKEPPQ